MNPQEKVIFDNQEVSKFGKSVEKPFIGGIGSILTSLVVLSLLGVALYFLFLSHDPKQETSPTPTPNWSLLIDQAADNLKVEKKIEMAETDTWKEKSSSAEERERLARQDRADAAAASDRAAQSRQRQQEQVDNMDLYRQRLLPSPSSQPTDSPER